MKLGQAGNTDDLQAMPEINVVPLIDVFLVLLVIFMITAPVIKSAIEMGLPQAATASPDPTQGLTVKVMPDGSVWIDDQRVAVSQFTNVFAETWSATGEPGSRDPVFLAAAEDVPYGDVITVLDEIRAAGVVDLGLITANIVPEEDEQ